MSLWVDLQTIGAAWASAVATAGATGTALWLALSDRRQRHRDRVASLALIASGVAVYLEELRLELITALKSMNKGLSMNNPKDLAEFLAVVEKNLRSLNTSVLSSHELAILSVLPENGGEKIYTALACVRSVQEGLSRRLEIVTDAHEEADVIVKYWRTQLEWAHGLIEDAQSVCAAHGTLKIIRPKAERALGTPMGS